MAEPSGASRAILLAAEQHFAQYGLHGASLRQISEAAGQRNASAIQYHFGSRDKLVEAVFALRMAYINPRRDKALRALEASGRLGDVRGLVGVMVWPMAEELRPRAEGNHYLQFLSRASREKLMALELTPPQLMTAWFETRRHVEQAIRYLPAPIVQTRFLLASEQSIAALAAFEADGIGGAPGFEFRVETLIDMIAAGLESPVSQDTLDALDAS